MALIKLNNRAVKDASAFGSVTSLGSLSLIQKQTASSSASISFTTGIDSTYKEYIFFFNNIHPQTDGAFFSFQSDTGTNTNYNQTITSTYFQSRHDEGDTDTQLAYNTGNDLAQSTSFQKLSQSLANENDACLSGYLHIFNPSSSTFVKHFIARTQQMTDSDFSFDLHIAGYFNLTTALTRFQFKFDSGNIDAGDILLYGVN
tara:strand:+ start:42 stop:647 length:606 start_codon:yes stop_codon:yes gene_type:complete